MKASRRNRERLFRDGKPLIRAVKESDIDWLIVAHRRSGNTEEDADELREMYRGLLGQFEKLAMIEDRNVEFGSGFGPVAIVRARYDGWHLEPHVDWMPWATCRNRLRGTVAYLHTTRSSRSVGVAVLRTVEPKWLTRVKKYVPIFPVGRIPGGHPDGDEHLFYVRGRNRTEAFYGRH